MLLFYISFIFHLFIPVCSQRLSRVIHQPNFSCLARTKFADYITCLATNDFPLNRHCIFASSLLKILSLNIPAHVPFPWFICYFSIPLYYKRLTRTIHLHNFSRPAGAQFAYCITCLATSHFVSFRANNCLSARSLVSYIHPLFRLNMSEYVLFHFMFHVPHLIVRLSRAINTFLVAWLAHNILIALPASPTHTLFWFMQTITILSVYLYFWVWTCLLFYSQCFTSFHPSVLT